MSIGKCQTCGDYWLELFATGRCEKCEKDYDDRRKLIEAIKHYNGEERDK